MLLIIFLFKMININTPESGNLLIEALFAIGLFLMFVFMVNKSLGDYSAVLQKMSIEGEQRVKRVNDFEKEFGVDR